MAMQAHLQPSSWKFYGVTNCKLLSAQPLSMLTLEEQALHPPNGSASALLVAFPTLGPSRMGISHPDYLPLLLMGRFYCPNETEHSGVLQARRWRLQKAATISLSGTDINRHL